MRVSFLVQVDQDRLLDESSLAAPTDRERTRLAAMAEFQGVLALTGDDGASARIEDVLEASVQNLCYNAVPRVLAGESVEILYFSYASSIRLEPSGPRVLLHGDHVDAAFPADTLLPALVGCGDRFVVWARQIKAADESYLQNLDHVASFQPAAVAALESSGLLEPGG